MKNDLQLKLQAFCDRELPEKEAAQIAEYIARNGEAQALVNELTFTSKALHSNELELKLPEGRDFFFSKIRRDIEFAEKQTVVRPQPTFASRFRRFVSPLSGFALIALATVATMRFYSGDSQFSQLAEVENMSESTDLVSFRSKSEHMFVVWVSDRTPESPAQESGDESILQ